MKIFIILSALLAFVSSAPKDAAPVLEAEHETSEVLDLNRKSESDRTVKSISSSHSEFQPTKSNPFGTKDGAPISPIERNDITYIGDTDVNYIGIRPRDNPDAEVFDANLVREDANRFFARRPQPIIAQPIRSQPVQPHPSRYQPIQSQPIRSRPRYPQPIRSQPIHPQPVHLQSVWPQAIRSQPQVWYHSSHSQFPRSQPVRSQPLRSQPIRSQPQRSQPFRSQPLRSQPFRSQPLRSQPIRSQPLRSQPIRSQPLRSQPIRSQPLRSQPPRSVHL